MRDAMRCDGLDAMRMGLNLAFGFGEGGEGGWVLIIDRSCSLGIWVLGWRGADEWDGKEVGMEGEKKKPTRVRDGHRYLCVLHRRY